MCLQAGQGMPLKVCGEELRSLFSESQGHGSQACVLQKFTVPLWWEASRGIIVHEPPDANMGATAGNRRNCVSKGGEGKLVNLV